MREIFNIQRLVAVLAILVSFNGMSQCAVDAGADTIYSNCGQSVYLSASVLSDSAVLTSDFNGGALGNGWSSSVNGLYSNPCGPTLDGTPALWFGNVPAPRTVTTNPFDVSCGGQVCFDLDFAADDVPGGDCEDPDLPNEGVYFQYSINGGATWVDIFYFTAIAGYANAYYQWDNYCFAIPAAAMTPNTMFQWDQPVVSSAANDHWGIDNVSIIPAICSVGNFDWSNIPGTGNGFDQWVSPMVNTTYIVTFTDSLISCADTITVIVPPTTAAATAVSNTLICPNCTDLDISFTNYNAGSIIDDFDPAVDGTMWDDVQNGVTGGGCGSMSGNALYFDGAGDRWLSSVPVDATAGCGFMGFSLFMGNVGSGMCENADAGEDVVLEYSINGGASWTTINTYYQSSWDANNSWQTYVTPIPPPAQTPATKFRWRQVAFTNAANNDNWAIDNISFVCNPPPFNIIWTPAVTLNDNTITNPIACPLDTTTYTATITDPLTGCTATANTTINVSCSCMFSALNANISSCENGNTFTVSGDFIYIENPGSGTIEVEVTNNSGTYTQTITGPFTDLTLTNFNISGIIADGSPLVVNVFFSDDLQCIGTLNDVSPVLPEVTLTSGSGVYCLGQAVGDIFVNVSGNGPFTVDYTLDGVPQSITSAVDTIINLGNLPGDYIITNISDSGCTNLAVGNETIIVQNVPTVLSVEDGGTYCANELVNNVFAVVTGTGPWDIDFTLDGVANSINSLTDTVVLGNTAGVYVVTGITDAGCSNAAAGTQTIIVNPMPVIFAGNDFINCEDNPITLTATGATNYVWDNNVVQGVEFTPTSTLTYNVVGTDANGCVGTDDITVTFEPTPDPSFVGDSTSGCEPMTVVFTNTTAGNFVDCQWIFGDGNTGVGCSDVSNIYVNGGLYDVTLTVTSFEGCSNSVTYDDYIYVEHNPSASFIPSLFTVLSLDTEVSFDNTTIGGVTYVWDFGDDTEQSTLQNPTHEFPGDQTSGYIVTLYAYSPIGCVDSTYSVIQVNEEVIYYIPNTFTPDGDEFNQTFQPIFTAGYDPYDFNMMIFNRWGEVVFETTDDTIGWDGSFNGRLAPDGTYSWKIEFKTISSDERILITGHVNMTK